MPDDVHPTDRRSTWGLVDLAQMPEGTDAEDALRRPEAKHFRLRAFSIAWSRFHR